MNPLVIAGTVFAAIAALIHVYISVLESVQWTKESTRRIFGIRSADDAELTKPLAFNQGFYNLFSRSARAPGWCSSQRAVWRRPGSRSRSSRC